MWSARPSKSQPLSGGHPLEPAPVVRHRAAAVGDDPPQPGEVAHEPRAERLHERGGVGAEVVRAGGVEVLVARRRHVDHRRHVELAHRLPQRPPVAVPQRRPGPEPAGRVGVDVAADEAHLDDAPLAVRRREPSMAAPGDCGSWHTGAKFSGYRSHTRRIELVLVLRPERRRVLVADVVAHPARPRREQREVGAAVALEPQLGGLEAGPDLVVGHLDRALLTDVRRVALDRRRPAPRATRRPRAASSCSARGSR